MKLPIIFCTVLLFLSAKSENLTFCSAVTYSSISSPASAEENHEPQKKPHKQRALYYKGKGTMGFLLTLALGPVGYISVHLFSNNTAMREKAKDGMLIWFGCACLSAIVAGAIISKQSAGQAIIELLEGIVQNMTF
jgi:hypothetical protein